MRDFFVPGAGLEPARRKQQGILSPSCLPIPPPRHMYGDTKSIIHRFSLFEIKEKEFCDK